MQLEKKVRSEVPKVSLMASLADWPTVETRTISVAGRQARLRLEKMVWDGLEEVSRREGRPVPNLCSELDTMRASGTPLATAIRILVLNYFREAVIR
ncbi:MAG TPA: ribbon-helix-helix domain-containing protein [Azospirillum sp.]|nr:ribbon-helix-helix domain-containing protein [Azospirillum sp.]